MQIFGFIILITGIILILVARNVSGNLPPDYHNTEDDDGFLQLLQSMGKLVRGAGILFIIVGVVCIFLGLLG